MAYSTTAGGGATWTPESDKVDGEVSRITSAGGPLMQQARTDGLAAGQRRGLLNSSMSVGSSQAAVLNAALPMAQQNASQTAQKNLANQEYGQNRGLAEQKFQYDTALSSQSYDQNRGLTELKGAWDSRLQGEKHQQDAGLSNQEYQQKTQLLNLDNTSKEKIASWNVSQYEKDRAMTALTAMEGLYANEFQNIAGNVNLPAEARNTYLQHIATLRDSTLGMVEQMYGINLTWASPATPSVA